MTEQIIFTTYLVSLTMICFSVYRQTQILAISKNGTRFTQKTFLIFNLCFAIWCIGKLLELAGFELYAPEIVRAGLIFIMSSVGFVFYSQNK